jgi:hypothetical protein
MSREYVNNTYHGRGYTAAIQISAGLAQVWPPKPGITWDTAVYLSIDLSIMANYCPRVIALNHK